MREESANNVLDRLDDITRSFPRALEIGSYRGGILRGIREQPSLTGRGGLGGIEELVQCDMIPFTGNDILAADALTDTTDLKSSFVLSETEELPFDEESFDLVLSSLTLHWINELPGTLVNIKKLLKPDGVFIGSFLGGDTLKELRYCFYLADLERKGGLGPHASPMAKASDIAGLMQVAGYALPTIDVDTVRISYPDAFTLMEHIVNMGEGNAAFNRQFFVGRDTMLAMAAIYQEMFGLEDGSVQATFEIIYVIGWSPHDSQPKACRRGSASASLKDLGKNKDD